MLKGFFPLLYFQLSQIFSIFSKILCENKNISHILSSVLLEPFVISTVLFQLVFPSLCNCFSFGSRHWWKKKAAYIFQEAQEVWTVEPVRLFNSGWVSQRNIEWMFEMDAGRWYEPGIGIAVGAHSTMLWLTDLNSDHK